MRNVTLHVLALVLCTLVSVGCSSSQLQQRADTLDAALNDVTAVADPGYEVAATLCNALETAQVRQAQAGTITLEQADAAVEDIRQRCNVVFAAFETVRESQRTLRVAADGMRDGTVTGADLLAQVATLRGVVAAARDLVTALITNGGAE